MNLSPPEDCAKAVSDSAIVPAFPILAPLALFPLPPSPLMPTCAADLRSVNDFHFLMHTTATSGALPQQTIDTSRESSLPRRQCLEDSVTRSIINNSLRLETHLNAKLMLQGGDDSHSWHSYIIDGSDQPRCRRKYCCWCNAIGIDRLSFHQQAVNNIDAPCDTLTEKVQTEGSQQTVVHSHISASPFDAMSCADNTTL
jgi:hypothetical protein